MLRLQSSYAGRSLLKCKHVIKSLCRLYFSASKSLQRVSDSYEDKKKEIDYLFASCNKVDHAKCLHALLVVSENAQSKFLSTKLLNIYAKLGSFTLSRGIFDQIADKDVYTWNSMLSAFVQNGRSREAVECFYKMVTTSNVRPDFYTFPPVLKACGNLNDGKKLHCWTFKLGLEWDVYVAASLIHMYSRFRFPNDARILFDDMPFRDMASWNAIFSGLCQYGSASQALDFFDQMRLLGVDIDSVTVVSILPVCAQVNDYLTGILIHLYVIKHGLEFDLFVSNALINMYAKLGCVGSARNIFDQMLIRDIVSWNSIIAAYEQNNDPIVALGFYNRMLLNGVLPDLLTLLSLSSIVGQSKDCGNTKVVHGYVTRRGWLAEEVIVGNAVVDMYAKLGALDSARSVFENISFKDMISWNTLISGYSQNGLASEAIEVYGRMQESEEIKPNQGTWVSILPAYSHVGALQQGMKVHALLTKNGLYLDVYVGTCLVDLYGKCGRVDDAMSLFHEVPRQSSVPWNAIISCYGVHGHGEKAMKLFREMMDDGVNPDHVTFVSLLSACSHSGLVDQGKWCFHVMKERYGLKPTLKHYGCMVDLFGRAGQLDTAYTFIKNMPMEPDASIWGALLGACRIHGHAELGSLASDRLFEVDSDNVGYYVLLSNIYANMGKWERVDKVRSLASERGLKKTPGWSSVEINNKVDVFYTGNQTHPQREEIYRELGLLLAKMKVLGYVPDYSFVLQDVEDDEKEHILTSHNERLAIAFGILNTPPKSSLRIFKNLRVCGDCHNATKYISIITEREIIVRDSNRFHHFKDGVCSCGDYW